MVELWVVLKLGLFDLTIDASGELSASSLLLRIASDFRVGVGFKG